MYRVSVVKCENYERQNAAKAMHASLNNLGGIHKFVKNGDKVLVKANLVMRKKPGDGVTTHPSLVEALCREVLEAGGVPIIGDSPGGPYNQTALRAVYRATGMEDVAKTTGAVLNYDTDIREVSHPQGSVIKNLTVMNCVEKADVVISFAKLKTHGMMLFTGAVKNLFGVIPGILKAEYHFNMPDTGDFANMLVDVCTYIKPKLSIIDGVVGMEGEGPSSGRLVNSGIILASENPFALDFAAVSLIGIDPNDVPTIIKARHRGLFTGDMNNIQLLGDGMGGLAIKRFNTPAIVNASFIEGKYPRFIVDMINRMVKPEPVFDLESCAACGDCYRVCPPGAITMQDNKPRVDLDKCIRCFCCQELCFHGSVKIYRPWLLRAIHRRKKRTRRFRNEF
ncbi:MAG: Iron-sulfur cluster-binding protein [Firmicutes bacterium]|nr:Iron-sulfur cluster-binding protein [Bacillota bacterium]MDI6704948.1 DUF362 domain-containing protein [Bacillota bacterium]